jgi:hypothetical protein
LARGYSPILVQWLTGIVEKDPRIDGTILDRLLLEAMPIPEPMRSTCITELWNLFDRVNEILKYAEEVQRINPTLGPEPLGRVPIEAD